MRTFTSTLILLVVFSFFQSCGAEQNTSTEPPIAQTSATENEIEEATELQGHENTNTETSTTSQAEEPNVTIDPNKIKSAVSSVSLQATPPTAKTADAPTVVELKPTPETVQSSTKLEQPSAPTITEEEETVAMPNHALFDALLRKAVSSSGQVNYVTIKNSNAELEAYISELANNLPDKSWGKNNTMAYWINAYNAFTLKLVAENYPISSIKDLHGGNPWDVKWINLGGNTYSLNQIENEMLRARYGDARIHFAVNCAAKSCPPLHNSAFTGDNLNGKLSRLTRSFLSNENYNTIAADQLTLSQIFDWYAKDFGQVANFVNQYTQTEVNSDASIQYKEYDWALNK